MRNVSGIKKVAKIFGKTEIVIYDKPNEREQNVVLEEERVYVIPAYQREIRWEPGNVQMLIDDLKDGSKFLGTITLSTSEPQSFDVIDGQQRMTVITLLITYLNTVVPENKRSGELCKIDNKSFPLFNHMLDYRFNYNRVQNENKPLFDELVITDSLSQREHIRKLWNCIAERVEALSESEKTSLLTALLESDLNVIVNEIDGTDTQRKFCVDYFIDINNKSVALDSVDIIRAYAFKEDFVSISQKWINIQSKCHRLAEKVKYTRDDLYFQYFICNVNKELGYAITKLSNDYRIKENVKIDGMKYASGTFVWNMFTNDRFYSELLTNLNDYLDFIDIVTGTETGGVDEFKKFFHTENGGLADETRILNAHTIINAILRNDDLIPKMMIMKYYFEVLKPERTLKSRYRIISYINIIANVFTMSKKRKGSEVIAAKLLQEDWQKALKDYANRIYLDIPCEIGFEKIARINGKYTVESGQYLARRYFSMKDACTWKNSNVCIDENNFKNENVSTGDKNIEHFIVNREYRYALYLDDGETVDIEVALPGRHRKNVATIANYLIMNSSINAELKNRPVYEKIEILEDKMSEVDIDYVIPSETCRKHYYLIKKIMHDESKYPRSKINETKTKKERKKILKSYYQTYFEDEFALLTESLANEDKVFVSELEYKLKKIGFYKEGDLFLYDHDSIFTNVEAAIDERKRKVTMSAELYNPAYFEKNNDEEYAELLSRVIDDLTQNLGKAPEIHSSNEWGGSEDESFVFSIEYEPDIQKIEDFLGVLSDISEGIA